MPTRPNIHSAVCLHDKPRRPVGPGDGEAVQPADHLNTTNDAAFFEKTAKLTPYALNESALVAAFLIPVEVEEVDVDD